MQTKWKRLLSILFLSGLLAAVVSGCGADTPAPDNGQETQTPQESQQASDDKAEKPAVDEGISINGTAVSAAGKTVNLYDRNEFVQTIASSRWLEKNKIAVLCEISGTKSQDYYFAGYDVVRDLYVYEQYGKQFIWQNDDLDTLVYVLDYAAEKEPSKVCNKKDMVLYQSSAAEQITGVSFVPKGLKVELADLRGDNARLVIVEAAT